MAAAIRVANQASRWGAQGDGATQGFEREVFLDTIADSPAHDAPGVEVHDNCQIQPPLVGPDIADIDTPFLVWAVATEILIKDVRCNRANVVAVGCLAKAPPLPGLETIVAHQSRDPVASCLNTVFAQLGIHAR